MEVDSSLDVEEYDVDEAKARDIAEKPRPAFLDANGRLLPEAAALLNTMESADTGSDDAVKLKTALTQWSSGDVTDKKVQSIMDAVTDSVVSIASRRIQDWKKALIAT